ncbi:MFS transporter [Actinomycetospora sp. CA-084318]|uniref:MFS transporter n=1 Tax=Actinomycetospora sp. CA-084318 TaxID=3239892 RepID=UPI003D969F08
MRRRVPPWFLGLLVCVLATQTALNLARPLVSYRAIGLGADATAVGIVTAAYALLPIVVAVPLGRATDRLGRSAEVLLLGVVLLGAAPLLLAAADALWSVGLASTTLGFGHLAFMIAAQGLVAARSPSGDLDRAFGVFTAVTSAGQLVGPLLAGALLGDASGAALLPASRTALLVAGACVLPALPVALVMAWRRLRRAVPVPDAGSEPAGGRTGIPALLRRPGMRPGLLVSLALLATVDLVTAYLPLLAEERGIAPSVVGVLLGARAGASLASRLLLGRLAARWARSTLVVASAAGSAVALVVAAWPGAGVPVMALALPLCGFFLGIGQPLTMTLTVRSAPASARSTALALRLLAHRVGQVAVPAGAGLVAGAAGAAGALWLAGGLLAGSAAAAADATRRGAFDDG